MAGDVLAVGQVLLCCSQSVRQQASGRGLASSKTVVGCLHAGASACDAFWLEHPCTSQLQPLEESSGHQWCGKLVRDSGGKS
jgi:hypothetical protein